MRGNRFLGTMWAVTARQVRKFSKTGHFVPPLLIPALFLGALAGGLSTVSKSEEFHFPDDDLYVRAADGSGTETRLTSGSEVEQDPNFQPVENGRILFLSEETGDREIFTMRRDGTDRRNITNNEAADAQAAYSPDGRQIVFGSDRAGNDDIWVMGSDGASPRNVSNNPADEINPSWSPDGEQIVFRRDLGNGNFEIFLMNADGSDQKQLTKDPARDIQPSFSPDGETIVFASDRDGNPDIFTMRADGSRQRALTRDPGFDAQPAFSPNGRQISFQSTRGGNEDIWVMNADATSPRNVTNGSGSDGFAAWSPDGEQLAYQAGRDGNYTTFVFVFVLLQGAAFSAIFSSVTFAEDLEGKFASRMMLAVPKRMAIVLGVAIAAMIEAAFVMAILFGIALAAGMDIATSPLQLLALLAIGLLLNLAVSFFGAGLALRIRSMQAAPLMMLPTFAVLFIAPVYVARDQLSGWLGVAADWNPVTPMLEVGRGLLIDKAEDVWLAFACAAGMLLVFYVYALTGMRKAERTV